jgi:hypothetical protein
MPVAAPALHLNRRGFLGGLLAALTVPAIIKIDGLTAITPELITSELVIPDYLWVARFDVFQHMFTVSCMAKEKGLELTRASYEKALAYRVLPDEVCHRLTDRYGRFCRPDSEIELILKPEEMDLPAFASLVPQREQWGQGRRVRTADIMAGQGLQHRIDGAA